MSQLRKIINRHKNPEQGLDMQNPQDDYWLRAIAETDPHELTGAIIQAEQTILASANPSYQEKNDLLDAAMIEGYRKYHGRRGMAAAWVAGIVLITGMGAAIDNVDVTAESRLLNGDKELTENVFKVGSALAVGMAFGSLIGPISYEAGNSSAKKRARKIIS